MKKTVALLEKFIKLSKGEILPSSSLKGDWIEQMLMDGILIVSTKGSRKSYRACDEHSIRSYLSTHYDIRDLEAYCNILKDEETSRAEQVKVTGNSKTKQHRTFRGFLVNCYSPINVHFNGKSSILLPDEGTFVFVSDYETFSIPEDVIVVGVENAENFRYIKEQKWLFDVSLSKQQQILFVSRYPQEQSHDLMDWLLHIQNPYIHFGDLDLAGVHIYLTEYYTYLGERSSFFIPKDYEQRIASGSSERYRDQYSQYGNMKVTDERVLELLACIHKYHRGYDQEGYINEITSLASPSL